MKGVKLVGHMDMAQFKIHPWVGGLEEGFRIGMNFRCAGRAGCFQELKRKNS